MSRRNATLRLHICFVPGEDAAAAGDWVRLGVEAGCARPVGFIVVTVFIYDLDSCHAGTNADMVVTLKPWLVFDLDELLVRPYVSLGVAMMS